MADGTTKDVTARLTIESEGEPKVFDEAAQGVAGLAGAAGAARGPLGEIAADLERLAETASDLGAAQAEIKKFAEALAALDKARTLDEQKAALDRAIAAWKSFGQQVPAAIKESTGATRDLDKILEGLQKKAAELVSPLAKAFADASQAVDEFGRASGEGLGSAKKEGEEARVALDRLRQTIDEVKASGQGLGSDQAAELARLEQQYDAAVQGVARAGKAQREFGRDVDEASKALGGQVQRVNDVNDIVGALGPRLEGFATRWSNALGAISIASEGLREVESRIDSLTNALGLGTDVVNGLDDTIPGTTKLFEQWGEQIANLDRRFQQLVDRTQGYSDEVEETTNLQKILRSQGIDPSNLSLDQMRQKYSEVVTEMQKVAAAAAALRSQAFGAFIDPAQFEAGSAAMARFIEQVRGMGSVSPGAVDGLRQALQSFVDEAYRAGREIPPQIEQAARSMGIATTEAERQAQAQEKWAAGLGLSKRALQEQTVALVDHLAKLQASSPNISLPDLNATFGPQIQALLDQYQRLGQQVPPELQKIADGWGIVSSAQQRQADLIADITGRSKTSMAELITQAGDLVGALSRINIGGLDSEGFENARAKLRDLIAGFQAAGQQIPPELAAIAAKFVVYADQSVASSQKVADAMSTTSGQVSSSVSSMASSVDQATGQLVTSTENGRTSITNLGQAAGDVQVKSDGARTSITNLGTAAQEAGSKTGSSAQDLSKAGDAAAKAGESAAKGAKGLGEGAKGAQDAGTALETLGTKANEAGGKVAGSIGEIGKSKETLDALAKAISTLETQVGNLGKVATALGDISGAMANIRSNAAGLAEPILAELDKVIAKADEAAAKLSKLTAKGGGEAPKTEAA